MTFRAVVFTEFFRLIPPLLYLNLVVSYSFASLHPQRAVVGQFEIYAEGVRQFQPGVRAQREPRDIPPVN